MKRFSMGLLAGLAALMISPQAMAGNGWCQNNSGAPFQDSFSFVQTFTDPSQNQAGRLFNRLYEWNTGGNYRTSCDCNLSAILWAKATIPGLTQTQTRNGLNFYRLNEYLEVASEIYLAGYKRRFFPTPVNNQDFNIILCGAHGTYFDAGSRGYISLYFTRPFVGQVTIPPTVILNVYGSTESGSYSSIPMTQISMSGTVTVPQSCEINIGQPIHVDFGDIAANNFKTVGQKPTGFTPHTVTMTLACTNISAGVNISLSFQGAADSHDNSALATSNNDIGVRIENITGTKIPVLSGLLPVNMNYSAQTGETTMKIYPINTSGNLPAGGGFSATATIQAEIQ